jgi:hypothetical protein
VREFFTGSVAARLAHRQSRRSSSSPGRPGRRRRGPLAPVLAPPPREPLRTRRAAIL